VVHVQQRALRALEQHRFSPLERFPYDALRHLQRSGSKRGAKPLEQAHVFPRIGALGRAEQLENSLAAWTRAHTSSFARLMFRRSPTRMPRRPYLSS